MGRNQMVDEILKFTKLTFLIHFFIAVLFAILYFIPEISFPLFGVINNPVIGMMGNVIGAL